MDQEVTQCSLLMSKRKPTSFWKKLRENATWDDLMYKIYARQAIEAGLSASEAGRTIDVKDVRASLGCPSESTLDFRGIGT